MRSLALQGFLLLACFVSFVPRPVASTSFMLSSNQASYVIDLEHGCSVSGAWAQGDPAKTNLINTADLGRYVQVGRVCSRSHSLRHGVPPRQASTLAPSLTTAAFGAAARGLGVRAPFMLHLFPPTLC